MSKFIPGLDLCRTLYEEAVHPLLNAEFPSLAHSAGRIGEGSDALGFDTPMSMDHGWGPRVELFLSEEDFQKFAKALYSSLMAGLPSSFRGFPLKTVAALTEAGNEIRPLSRRSPP